VPRFRRSARSLVRRLSPLALLLSAATVALPAHAEGVVARAARTGELVMGATAGLPPLVFQDASGEWTGYGVDVGRVIAAEISGAVGRPVKVRVVPTSDPRGLVEGVANGSLNLVCGVPFTWAADGVVDFSLPIAVSGLRVLAPAGRIDGSPASLQGRRIAVVEDSLADTELGGIQPQARAVDVPDLGAALDALQAGRVDGVIADSTLLAGLVKARGLSGLALTPDEPFETYAVSCMVPENDSQFRNLVNLAIARWMQAYLDGDSRAVQTVHRWVGPGGMRELPADQIREVFQMVLTTVEALRPLPPKPAR